MCVCLLHSTVHYIVYKICLSYIHSLKSSQHRRHTKNNTNSFKSSMIFVEQSEMHPWDSAGFFWRSKIVLYSVEKFSMCVCVFFFVSFALTIHVFFHIATSNSIIMGLFVLIKWNCHFRCVMFSYCVFFLSFFLSFVLLFRLLLYFQQIHNAMIRFCLI